MADDNGSQKVTVDGKEFSMDELSENAKAQFVNLQFVDAQLLQLQNELAVADYYISRNAYVASVRRARYVIENIPNSNQNLRALKILEVCYEKLGYVDLQDEIKAIIALNYPDSST